MDLNDYHLLTRTEAFDRNTKWSNWKEKKEKYLDTKTGVTEAPMSYPTRERLVLSNVVSMVTILEARKRLDLGTPTWDKDICKKLLSYGIY